MELSQNSHTAKEVKKKALGKGLESLLPTRRAQEAVISQVQPDEPAEAGRPHEIPLDAIDRNPYQTRTNFDMEKLKELAESIRATGVVQPILVRPTAEGRFQLIAGERRWLASKHAGLTAISAVVRKVSDEQALEMTIVENLQRADLNPMEQARAFDRLGRQFKMTQEQMAARTGKDRTSIANFLRLLRLPPELQEKVEGGELSFGHARTLLALGSADVMMKAAQKISALSMSVRQTETYVQGLLHPQEKEKTTKLKEPLDPNVREARDLIQRALGLRVHVEDKAGRGKIIIEYSHLDDFDRILDRLGER